MAKKLEGEKFIDKSGIINDLSEVSKALLELQKQSLEFQKILAKNLGTINKELNELKKTVSGAQGVFKGFTGNTKEQREEAKKLAIEIIKLTKEFKEQRDTQKATSKAQEDSAKTVKALESQLKRLKNEAKDVNIETEEGRKNFFELAKEVRATKTQVKTFNDALRATKQAFDGAEKSYNGIIRKNKELVAEVRQLNPEIAEEAKRIKLLQREIRANTDTLKKFDDALGRNFRNVGNYQSALKGATGATFKLGTALGAGFLGVQALANGIKEGFQAFVGFEFAIAKVGAVSGATRSELLALENNARDLGSSTQFTATQVADLQLEFAKLGFTAKEIVNVTGATLDLATATGESLAKSAAVAGTTLRGFGLDVMETGRVTDVMAKSFSSSALDLDSFKESMKLVAPIAKSAGVPLEQVTAMLSSLADAGIKGSAAGTSLRRILTDMSATGKPASEALRELSEKGITLTDAMDEVGRTAQTSLLILSENQAKTDGLTVSYRNATGSAKAMADQMRATTKGAIDQLSSAVEGLGINVFTFASKGINFAIKAITSLVGWLNSWFEASPVNQIENERIELLALTEALKLSNDDRATQNEIINELNQKYPGLLENIKAEQLSNEELASVLKETVSTEKGKSDLISEINKKYPLLLKGIDTEKISSEGLAKVLGEKLNKEGIERQQVVATLTNLQGGLIDGLVTEKITTEQLANELVKANNEEDKRKQLIQVLEGLYPGFIDNIDTEKISSEELAKVVETKANKSSENRAKLIDKINEISPELIENLKREKIETDDVTKATSLLNRELQKKIFIQLKAEAKEQFREETQEVFNQTVQIIKLKGEVEANNKEREKTLEILKREGITDLSNATTKAKLNKLVDENKISQAQLNLLLRGESKERRITLSLIKSAGGESEIQKKQVKELKEEFDKQNIAIEKAALLLDILPEELKEAKEEVKEVNEEIKKTGGISEKGAKKLAKQAEDRRALLLKENKERRKLSEKQLQNEIKNIELLLQDENLSAEAKIMLTQQLFDKRESLLNQQSQNETERIQESESKENIRAEKIKQVNEALANSLLENQNNLNKELDALNKEKLANEQKAIQDAIKEIEKTLEQEDITLSSKVLEDLTKLSKAFKAGEITYEEFQKELTKIQKEESQKRLENEIKSLQAQLAVEGLTAEQRIAIQKNLTQKQRQLLENSIEKQKGLTGDFLKDILKLSDEQIRQLQIIFEIGQQGIDIINQSFENRLAKIEAEEVALEEKFARQFELAEGNATLEAQVEAQRDREKEVLDKKRQQVELKKFRFDKALKIAGAVGNIAQGITKTIAEFGLPFAFPFIAAIAGLGAFQIAQIASTKPPQGFKEGTERLELDGNKKGTDTIPALLRPRNSAIAPSPILLDENERILTAKQNQQIGYDFPNSEIPKAVQFYKDRYSAKMVTSPLRDLNRTQSIIVRQNVENTKAVLLNIQSELQRANQIGVKNAHSNKVTKDATIANFDQLSNLQKATKQASDNEYYRVNK